MTQFSAPPDEKAGLAVFLDDQRRAILSKLDELTDELATTRSTVSDFCLLTLVKHVAFVERRWFQLEIARRDVPGLWPPPDNRELEVEPEDSVSSIRDLYEATINENRTILDEVDDLGSVSDATGLNRRWVLLHLIEELARHAGHADILREAIDGRTGT
ncbi:MAG: DinB family protein [Actinobacteria bacterium]|nr:DinB family protein [Actinomycetota bacterium]